MERREAVRYISFILGGTLTGMSAFLSGCNLTDRKRSFSKEDIAMLDEVADTILPETKKSPGAKAARVGDFMSIMVNECYDEKQQDAFFDGMNSINELSHKQYSTSFVKATAQQKHQMLVHLDKEQKEYTKKQKPEDTPHYFRMMKELTLLGYFTSEPGATKAKRYVPVPGRFDGCVPYEKGEGGWA
jgi:hypothetical protein